MTNFFDVVNSISYLDKEREKYVKMRAEIQESLEKLLAFYLICLFHGLTSYIDRYVELIKEGSEVVIPSIDIMIEALEKSSKMLKDLMIKKAPPEELEKGLEEVDKNLKEANNKSKELYDKFLK